jgi:hypothetical protein
MKVGLKVGERREKEEGEEGTKQKRRGERGELKWAKGSSTKCGRGKTTVGPSGSFWVLLGSFGLVPRLPHSDHLIQQIDSSQYPSSNQVERHAWSNLA